MLAGCGPPIFETKASELPPRVVSRAPAVVGELRDQGVGAPAAGGVEGAGGGREIGGGGVAGHVGRSRRVDRDRRKDQLVAAAAPEVGRVREALAVGGELGDVRVARSS